MPWAAAAEEHREAAWVAQTAAVGSEVALVDSEAVLLDTKCFNFTPDDPSQDILIYLLRRCGSPYFKPLITCTYINITQLNSSRSKQGVV